MKQASLVLICSEVPSEFLSPVTSNKKERSLSHFFSNPYQNKKQKKQTSDVCEINFSLSLIITHLYNVAHLGCFNMPIDRYNLIHTNVHGQLMTKLLPAFLTLEQEEILGFTLSLSLFFHFSFPISGRFVTNTEMAKRKGAKPNKTNLM